MSNESAQIARLEESIRENPANQSYYRAALANACDRISFDALADIVGAAPAPATCTVRPKNAIVNLVRNGALSQSIEVDGRPYEGSYEELLADEGVSPETHVVYFVTITAHGRALLASMSAHAMTDNLFTDKPTFTQGFLAVLDVCARMSAGASKQQIEQTLHAHSDALRIDERTGLATVSPSFYTTSLEDAGALNWDNGLWHVTEAGATALAEWKAETNRGEGGTRT